ncbi:MAG: hypothetical protein ACYTGR_02255 [Planctomycetota bacterium]|jgi:hypothetical protein
MSEINAPGGHGHGPLVQKADAARLKQWVTELKSAEQQVGEHIIQALQDEDTVAVLTTAVIGPDGAQRLVSAGLSPQAMAEVQMLLTDATEERDEEVPCVGFHCFVHKHEGKAVEPQEKPE